MIDLVRWRLERRRRGLRRRATGPAMAAYLATPIADLSLPVVEAELVSVDLETTGLDARDDQILSLGAVTVRHGRVDLATARYGVVCPDRPVDLASPTIHGIGHDAAARGRPLDEVLSSFLEQLAGRVLLAHGAEVEIGFLSAAARRLYGVPLVCPVVDTAVVEMRRRRRRGAADDAGGLRLTALRDAYHLPRYKAHHALSDALATAELFLAQSAHCGPAEPLKTFLR